MPIHFTKIAISAAVFLAPLTAQQSKSHTLLAHPFYAATSLDATAGPIRGAFGRSDTLAVTPGSNSAAFPFVPAATLSAMMGDANNDGVLPEFNGRTGGAGLYGIFVKDADRDSNDPSKLFFGIQERSANDPKIVLHTATGTHTVKMGDFFRFKPDGTAELFITQAMIMNAAGTQTNSWVDGCNALCQDSKGNLYYSAPYGLTNAGTGAAGGHWVGGTWCNDGTIVQIPVAAITYDADGNVQATAPGSARIVAKEVGGTVTNVRAMCVNSGAVDSAGNFTAVTYHMNGLDIDPNGGTFQPQFSNTETVPNLIFSFSNVTWRGTVFSTAKNSSGADGSIAVINGTTMGTTTGTADGSWWGLVDGSGSTPVSVGLCVMQTGYNPAAPFGHTSIKVPNEGLVDLKTDPNIRLAIQGAEAFLPVTIGLGLGIAKGAKAPNVDINVWNGFGPLYTLNLVALLSPGIIDAQGRADLVVQVPTNDPTLIGVNVLWQAVSVGGGNPGYLSNPVVTEIR